jgi:hypothetical protein
VSTPEGPAIRPTANTVNDNQLDALFDGLEQVFKEHYPHEEGDRCTECHQRTPCRTVETIRLTWMRVEAAVEDDECPS